MQEMPFLVQLPSPLPMLLKARISLTMSMQGKSIALLALPSLIVSTLDPKRYSIF
jgi:hypothetical protein